ncbi:MAG: P-II family nitrogen regulator [Thermoguttaceae bacterium]|nr:P-II family nitrogen regulator [Thermoguttaceae bacterium]
MLNDDYPRRTIDTIIQAARTEHIGDGKIFVMDLADCIRIRTGERGPEAIGNTAVMFFTCKCVV